MALIDAVKGGATLQYDSTKAVTQDTLKQVEALFDTKGVHQIYVKANSNIYIISKKDDGSLEIRNESGSLIDGKTVQDILQEFDTKKLENLLNAYNNNELELKNTIIRLDENLSPATDIAQKNIDQFSNASWQKLIKKHLSRAENNFNMADYGGAKEHLDDLDKVLQHAPENVKTEFKDRIDPIRTKLTEIEGKKQAFVDHIPKLTIDKITAIANAYSTSFPKTTSIGDKNYQFGEISVYLDDPAVFAQVAIRAAQVNPSLLTTDETIFKHEDFDIFSDPKLKLALSKNLPKNQRIISFKEEVGGKEVTRYMLVQRESNGNYTILSQGYDNYSVEMDDGQFEVKTPENGTVDEVDLVVDHQWHRFAAMGLNGTGYEVYQRTWEDGYITQDEAQGKNGLGFSDAFYHFAATGGFTSREAQKGDGISWNDLTEAFALSADLVPEGQRGSYLARLVKAPIISRIPTDKAAEKLMGDKTEYEASKALELVASDKKAKAKQTILAITGKTEYKYDIKLTEAQLAQFLYIMCYDSDQDTSKIKTVDNVFEVLKGKKVEEKDTAETKGATDKKKDYVEEYQGKKVEALWAERVKILKELEDLSPKMTRIKEQFKPSKDNPLPPSIAKDSDVKKHDENIARLRAIDYLLPDAEADDPEFKQFTLISTGSMPEKEVEEITDKDSDSPPYLKAFVYVLNAQKAQQNILSSLRNKPDQKISEPELRKLFAKAGAPDSKKAKELLEKEYFENGKLKTSVPAAKKAIILYLYSLAISGSGGSYAKSSKLILEAQKALSDLPKTHPLYEQIEKVVEKKEKELEKNISEDKNIVTAVLDYEIAMDENDFDTALTNMPAYLKYIKDKADKEDDPKKKEAYLIQIYQMHRNLGEYDQAIAIATQIKNKQTSRTALDIDWAEQIKNCENVKTLINKNIQPAEYLLRNFLHYSVKANECAIAAQYCQDQGFTEDANNLLKQAQQYEMMARYAALELLKKNRDNPGFIATLNKIYPEVNKGYSRKKYYTDGADVTIKIDDDKQNVGTVTLPKPNKSMTKINEYSDWFTRVLNDASATVKEAEKAIAAEK